MTKNILLEKLKAATEEATGDIIMPVAAQKGDTAPPKPRAAEVYKTRLPDSRSAKKKSPVCPAPDHNGKGHTAIRRKAILLRCRPLHLLRIQRR